VYDSIFRILNRLGEAAGNEALDRNLPLARFRGLEAAW
jgi:hypothetical protein